MKTITLKALAKINLTLDITGTLDNGYHTIKSFFHPITLCDKITITKTNSGIIEIVCDKPHIPIDHTNLCYKAAELFFQYTQLNNSGLIINIEKHIPDQAGLGGGSADAAATLNGLNQIYNTNIDKTKLSEIGFSIGADVAFCVLNKPAFVTGMGEKIDLVNHIPQCHIVVVKPDFGSCTKQAYSKYDSSDNLSEINTNEMGNYIKNSDLIGICNNMGNVFEELINNMEIFNIKEKLVEYGALGSSMSGSGTAVFGIFDNNKTAIQAADNMKEIYEAVFICEPYRG